MQSRIGRMPLIGMVLVLLVGCGLLPGGEKGPDWAGLAERIMAVSGSDEIVGAELTASGQLSLKFRVDGGFVSWIYAGKGEPMKLEEPEYSTTSLARDSVGLDEIDFTGLAAAMPPDCTFGSVRVEWLLFGHVYQQAHCAPDEPAVSVLLDGAEIGFAGESLDEASVGSAADLMSKLLDGGEALQFWISLLEGGLSYSITGPEVTLPDGTKGYLNITHFPASSPAAAGGPLGMAIDNDPAFVVTSTPPQVAFRPADVPAGVYLQALNDGLAKASFAAGDADAIGFSALSGTELGYTVYDLATKSYVDGSVPL